MVGGIDYKHVGEINDPNNYGCSNGCVYESVYGNPNAQYCFKPGLLSSECVKFPFTTPAYHGNHLYLLSLTMNRHAFLNEKKKKPNRTASALMKEFTPMTIIKKNTKKYQKWVKMDLQKDFLHYFEILNTFIEVKGKIHLKKFYDITLNKRSF